MSITTDSQVVLLRQALNQAIKAVEVASQYLDKDQQAEVDRMLDGHEGLNIYVIYSTTATETPGAVEHLVQCNRIESDKAGCWRTHRQWRQELREVRLGIDEALNVVTEINRRLDVAETEVMRKVGL